MGQSASFTPRTFTLDAERTGVKQYRYGPGSVNDTGLPRSSRMSRATNPQAPVERGTCAWAEWTWGY